MDSETESSSKLNRQLVELMRPLGCRTTLRVSQVASILGVEGEEQYQHLLDLLARSHFLQYDAEKQTVRPLLELKNLEDDDEAALLALSDVDVVGGDVRGRRVDVSPLLGRHRQHRSNSRHSYRVGGSNAAASGYWSDSGLANTTCSVTLLSRRRAGGTWTKPGRAGLEDAASYPGPVGRVGYLCVADELHLGKLEAYYRAQGYYTKFDFDVLHVRFAQSSFVNVGANAGDIANTLVGLRDRQRSRYATATQQVGNDATQSGDTASSPSPPPLLEQGGTASPAENSGVSAFASSHGYGAMGSNARNGGALPSTFAQGGEGGEAPAATSSSGSSTMHYFDLFVFPYGAVVWWGFDQRYFKIVENDYMLPHSAIAHCMTNRYTTKLVNENYPVWCTFNLVARDTLEVDDNFKARLRFDHFVIPYRRGEVATGSVLMLCASHALAQSAKIDYIELQVQGLADSCSPLPRELREKGAVSITERRLLQLRGEVLSYRLMLKSGSDLLDQPDFFWENSYLKPVFQATKEEYEISERVEALDNKLDAANEILSMLAEDFSQRHGARLEWIVIWLVFVEVVIGVLGLLIDVRPWLQSNAR
ncbi:putative ACR, YagE family COG1723 [Leishmania utingensis]|uniref:ACR, YagE family COG1723 n=1 Tax=Leishmania utingensis TaxID=653362 RepID=A0AAW3AUI4_9TRYP